MKVFVSWSGLRSKAVAELLRDWIKCVLQATRPWISTRDIDRGALWFSEIGDQLKETSVGIICLTAENRDRPWILFEAGALAKGLSSNRVCTFLIDLKPADLEDPLAQFNHTLPDKDGLWSLVRTLNSNLAEQALDERTLDMTFTTYWPQFESKFSELLKGIPPGAKPKPKSEQTLLGEILDNTRALTARLRVVEMHLERGTDTEFYGRALSEQDFLMQRRELRALIRHGAPRNVILDFAKSVGLPKSIAFKEIERAKIESAGQKADGTTD